MLQLITSKLEALLVFQILDSIIIENPRLDHLRHRKGQGIVTGVRSLRGQGQGKALKRMDGIFLLLEICSPGPGLFVSLLMRGGHPKSLLTVFLGAQNSAFRGVGSSKALA